MANFLLVSGRSTDGGPTGVAPDLATEIARRLQVPLVYVPYDSPSPLADAATDDSWDIGLIGAEPSRAENIDFTAAYCEIEATYLVPADSPLQGIEDVDRNGNRIAVSTGKAYDLYLSRTLNNAELVRGGDLDATFELFVDERLDAMAGLRPRLIADLKKLPGGRMLDGNFMAVQQAIGTPKGRASGFDFLVDFIEEAKAGGLVKALIERHQVRGLSVARTTTKS